MAFDVAAIVDVDADAVPTVPVAVKTTGSPARASAPTVASSVLAPAVVPSVHDVSAAMPALFVVTVPPLAGEVLPPPAVTVKVTTTPETGLPLASRTITDGGVGTTVPAVALCA